MSKITYPTKIKACSVCRVKSHYHVVMLDKRQFEYYVKCGHTCPVKEEK